MFFSYQCGDLVEIRQVVRHGKQIEIRYRLVRPVEKTNPAHLALIPVGKLPVGKYHVAMVQEPTGRQLLNGRYESLESRGQYEQGENYMGR